jgi:hypothetical protein
LPVVLYFRERQFLGTIKEDRACEYKTAKTVCAGKYLGLKEMKGEIFHVI